MATLIIGASGAIGQALCAGLLAGDDGHVVIACVRNTPLPPDIARRVLVEMNVDIRDRDSLRRVLSTHQANVRCVWNLAAPLSVETARDPSVAGAVTVGGMTNLLDVLLELSMTCLVCFSDSIGSYGVGSPRVAATGRWLVEHSDHDAGSDYGRQKSACRKLLSHYEEKSNGRISTRWAVIPGVLHEDATWGAGTTEYALEAVRAARSKVPYVCPVPLDTPLPMIDRRDLVRGLVALSRAPPRDIQEPSGGYTMAGYSFTARELLALLLARFPGFVFSEEVDAVAGHFAQLWCDSLSAVEASRDLKFVSQFTLEDTLNHILSTDR